LENFGFALLTLSLTQVRNGLMLMTVLLITDLKIRPGPSEVRRLWPSQVRWALRINRDLLGRFVNMQWALYYTLRWVKVFLVNRLVFAGTGVLVSCVVRLYLAA